MTAQNYSTSHRPTWCPGCGNWITWLAIRNALAELNIPTHQIAVSFDIGCAGNMANNIKCYSFHSLHGRALPAAVGIKLANQSLTVLAVAGDGGAYGEGLNHLIHAARENINVTYLVTDNKVYSLTTGQSCPTTFQGMETKTTPWGEVKKPINPISLAIEAGATFVARGFVGELEQLKKLIKQAIQHQGFSLIDIIQPCVTFVPEFSMEFLKSKVFALPNDFDNRDKKLAIQAAQGSEKWPIGLFYQESRPAYEKDFPQVKGNLIDQNIDSGKLKELIQEFK
ncbi:MAG TPA: 2-oxoacid:ferredoxin oxidoreductase subunit beta [Candidatus Portnoybacteria bacterium]|nr:2-oxoacid:ferredoxin oxidoreductase subunit beta [Candidatus Portnoybacteria bacterium]